MVSKLFSVTGSCLNCPFSPGIEDRAEKGEKPSSEGSPVLFFTVHCMRCGNVKCAEHGTALSSNSCSARGK